MAILGGCEGIRGRVLPCELPWHIYCQELCTEICSCLALQSQVYSSYKSRTTLKDLIGISPNGSIYFVSELWSGSHQRSRAGDQERHVLSFKKIFIITFTSSVTFQLFFFLLSDFLHLFLVDSHDCFTSIMFCLSKKILIIAFTSIVLLQSPFLFLPFFVFADSDGWFTSIMFSFKKLFSSHSRALLLSFTFFVSATPSVFLVLNSSRSHDKLPAPYFVPCCTENISMIEMDHSLHCYHWMHFTKRLWEKVPTTTRHNFYCSFTKPDHFFRRN